METTTETTAAPETNMMETMTTTEMTMETVMMREWS